MGTLIAYVVLFVGLAALVAVSLLLESDADTDTPISIASVTPAASLAATPLPTNTPAPGARLNNEEPERYTWVLLLEVAPPGEELPTLITKREGAYVSPDRHQENVGGTMGDGEALNRFITVIDGAAWERSGGREAIWTPVDGASPALDNAGDPPYWHLFTVRDGALQETEPEAVPEDYTATPALLYELPLSDLPGLHNYLAANLNDAVPDLGATELNAVTVRYWLRQSDGSPMRIQVFPPEEVVPDTELSFNISLMNLDNSVVTIEDPALQP